MLTDIWLPEYIIDYAFDRRYSKKEDEGIIGWHNGFHMAIVKEFSQYLRMEIGDQKNDKMLIIEWENGEISRRSLVEGYSEKNFMSVTFIPSWSKILGQRECSLNEFNETINLMRKRTYDFALLMTSKNSISFNGSNLDGLSFSSFMKLCGNTDKELVKIEQIDGRSYLWRMTIAKATQGFEVIAIINGYLVQKGLFLNFILDQLVSKLRPDLVNRNDKRFATYRTAFSEKIKILIVAYLPSPIFENHMCQDLQTSVDHLPLKLADVINKAIPLIKNRNYHLLSVPNDNRESPKTVLKDKRKFEKSEHKGQKVEKKLTLGRYDEAYNASARTETCTLIICQGECGR